MIPILYDVTAVMITKGPVQEVTSMVSFSGALVETHCPSVRHRYDLALMADTDHIFVSDDDCEVDLGYLFAHYDGKRICNYMEPHYAEQYENLSHARITLVGWGALFPKALIEPAFAKYDAAYGRDELSEREADRIFTWFNAPHNTVLIDKVNHLPAATAPDRMSMEGRHYDDLREIIRRLETL